jgi:FtsZ-binding cell division protein ZapB
LQQRLADQEQLISQSRSNRQSSDSDIRVDLLRQENEQLKKELTNLQSQMKQFVSSSISTTNNSSVQKYVDEISQLKFRIRELETPTVSRGQDYQRTEADEWKRKYRELQNEMSFQQRGVSAVTGDVHLKARLMELESQLKLITS